MARNRSFDNEIDEFRRRVSQWEVMQGGCDFSQGTPPQQMPTREWFCSRRMPIERPRSSEGIPNSLGDSTPFIRSGVAGENSALKGQQ
jgi:hypothetical protein